MTTSSWTKSQSRSHHMVFNSAFWHWKLCIIDNFSADIPIKRVVTFPISLSGIRPSHSSSPPSICLSQKSCAHPIFSD